LLSLVAAAVELYMVVVALAAIVVQLQENHQVVAHLPKQNYPLIQPSLTQSQ
jgi:hypothetical protein